MGDVVLISVPLIGLIECVYPKINQYKIIMTRGLTGIKNEVEIEIEIYSLIKSIRHWLFVIR